MNRKLIPILAALGLLAGCYAEGNSSYVADGQTRRFTSLAACEDEATASYGRGQPIYVNYECRAIRFGMIADVRRYSGGRRVASGMEIEVHASPERVGVVTLYRTSPVTQRSRIHVATFDAINGLEYNTENCATARELFQSQPGVRVRYWCEAGLVSEATAQP